MEPDTNLPGDLLIRATGRPSVTTLPRFSQPGFKVASRPPLLVLILPGSIRWANHKTARALSQTRIASYLSQGFLLALTYC